VDILLQPLIHTHLPLLIRQSPSQNKRTSLHIKKKNQYLYFNSKCAFLLGPNILDLLVTSPTNVLDLLPTNLSHHTIHHQLTSLHLIHNHPKTFVILQVFNHQNSHVKKKKQTTHRNSKYAYPYSFWKCSINCHLFWHFSCFSSVKKNHPC